VGLDALAAWAIVFAITIRHAAEVVIREGVET
jgi:hypothetical protein